MDAITRLQNGNNLDSLRLLLAALVVLEHANNLFHVGLGDSARFSFFLFNLSDVAVSSFFVVSGMLTYISFERDPDIPRFYMRRLFRIFPAYWSVLALQVLVFCLLAGTWVLWDRIPYYLLVNGLTANFLAPSFLDGVPAINGSLWTIKIEAAYYVLLPLLFPVLVRWPLLGLVAVLSLVWAEGIGHGLLAKQLPGKLYLFAIGIALARVLPWITSGHSLIALFLLVPLMIAKFASQEVAWAGAIVEAALGTCLVLVFLRQWLRHEPLDISYTLYLVHYPVLVLVTRLMLPGQPFWQVLAAGFMLSLAVAVSLLLERPALRIGRGLVARAGKRSALKGGSPLAGKP